MSQKNIIYRHSEPNKYDHAEYGTICQVNEGNFISLWSQSSKLEENPNWIFIGNYDRNISVDILEQEINSILKLK